MTQIQPTSLGSTANLEMGEAGEGGRQGGSEEREKEERKEGAKRKKEAGREREPLARSPSVSPTNWFRPVRQDVPRARTM